MPYTGTDPDLEDLQAQITALQNSVTAQIAGLRTQIKQVTLTLEGELKTTNEAFVALKAYVTSHVTS